MRLAIICLLALSSATVRSEEPIGQGLSGTALRQHLRTTYTPSQINANMSRNEPRLLDEALARRESIDPKVIEHRDQRRVEITNLLIDAGVDLDAQDGYGATALYSAVTKGYVKLAMLLIKKGANVNTSTGIYIDGPGDVTPTHLATRYPRVLAALLDRRANASAPDTSGDTPLHWAVREGNIRSVELLVRAGADVDAKNAEGDTAADLCEPISLFGEQPHFADEERAEACRQIRTLLETGGGRP